MKNSIITEYLNNQMIDNSYERCEKAVFHVEISGNRAVKRVKVILYVTKEQIHILVELPMKVSRILGFRVFNKISWINFELAPMQNYEYCAHSEAFRFHTVVCPPESIDDITAAVQESIAVVCEDMQTIIDAIEVEVTSLAVDDSKLDDNDTNTSFHYANTGIKSYWENVDSHEIISFRKLQEITLNNHGQVILMQGPTGCGKSLLIKQLEDKYPGRLVKLTVEDIVNRIIDVIVHRNKNAIFDKIKDYDIVCVENIDMLKTTSAQEEVAYLINQLTKQDKSVVLNGIECCKRVPVMIQKIRALLQIYKFVEINSA